MEGVAAGAGTGGHRVVDREALLLDRVDEVDGGAVEVRQAHAVDYDVDAVELAELVAVARALVEEQLITQTGAATGLDGYAHSKLVASRLVERALELGGGAVAQGHTIGGGGCLGARAVDCHLHLPGGGPDNGVNASGAVFIPWYIRRLAIPVPARP